MKRETNRNATESSETLNSSLKICLQNSLMWLVETFKKTTKNSNSYTEFGLAITWVFEYVPDSGSYYRSCFLTMHRDSALDCYELQVAAVAQLPRSAAALLFPLVAPCCTPHFSIDAISY